MLSVSDRMCFLKNVDDVEITYAEYFKLAYHSIQELFENNTVSEATRLRTLRKLQAMIDAFVDITMDAAFTEDIQKRRDQVVVPLQLFVEVNGKLQPVPRRKRTGRRPTRRKPEE